MSWITKSAQALAVVPLAMLIAAVAPAQSAPRSTTPTADQFHRAVLQIVATYPTDGTHRYYWPKGGSWAGVTRDLHFGDRLLAKGDHKGRCYCCGLTFEVFWRAWAAWAETNRRKFAIPGVDSVADAKQLRKLWFGVGGNRSTLLHAIQEQGIGREVAHWPDARKGDFVQLWRRQDTGHSVVFLDWVYRDGRIDGFRYWSTQKSTQGIGERVERFARAGSKRGVDPRQLYVARVGTEPTPRRLRLLFLRGTEAVQATDADQLAKSIGTILRDSRADLVVWRNRPRSKAPIPTFGELRRGKLSVLWNRQRLGRPKLQGKNALRIKARTRSTKPIAIEFAIGDDRPAGFAAIPVTVPKAPAAPVPDLSTKQPSEHTDSMRAGRAASRALAAHPGLEAWFVDWSSSK